MTIEAVIFDMEGVLVDSEVYWGQSRVDFAQQRGKVWTDALQRKAMGRATVSWAALMKESLELEESVDEIIAEMKARVLSRYEQRLPTRPGALAAVQLAADRYRIALASGSPTEVIERVMQLTGLGQVFEVIVFGDTIPHGKPAPDIYLEALHRLGVQPQYAVGIEDSANGVRSLHAAGMHIIAAPSPDFPLPDDILALSDAHITSLEDLSIDLIEAVAGDS